MTIRRVSDRRYQAKKLSEGGRWGAAGQQEVIWSRQSMGFSDIVNLQVNCK